MYKLLGFLFVGLATIGIFAPFIPTTPFLLLAASCFAKSSERWYNWLINQPRFGPIIQNWEERRCVPFKSKIIAISMILLCGGCSMFFALQTMWPRLIMAAVLGYGVYFVSRLKVCDCETRGQENLSSE